MVILKKYYTETVDPLMELADEAFGKGKHTDKLEMLKIVQKRKSEVRTRLAVIEFIFGKRPQNVASLYFG